MAGKEYYNVKPCIDKQEPFCEQPVEHGASPKDVPALEWYTTTRVTTFLQKNQVRTWENDFRALKHKNPYASYGDLNNKLNVQNKMIKLSSCV